MRCFKRKTKRLSIHKKLTLIMELLMAFADDKAAIIAKLTDIKTKLDSVVVPAQTDPDLSDINAAADAAVASTDALVAKISPPAA